MVLLPILGYLLMTITLVCGILNVSSSHRKISTEQCYLDQAMYIAEGGLEIGVQCVSSNIVALVSSVSGSTNGTGTIGNGTYAYGVQRVTNNVYSIVSTGTVVGPVTTISRIVSLLRIYQPTYAEFALWSHVNGAIYFTTGETFSGHVHADDQLYFNNASGGPVFHGIVSSLASTYQGSITGIEFDQGFFLNSYQGSMADVDFNSAASTSLKNTASSQGLVLNGLSTLTFQGSTVKITNPRAGWTNHVYTLPSQGLIYVAAATSGSSTQAVAYLNGGTISGQLTVATENDMYIQNNITYNSDPRTNSASTDALGLISMSDIWVNTNAPNNVTVQAAMIAAGKLPSSGSGSFGVINYDDSSNPQLGNRGSLTLYGGIVQAVRGAVGTLNNQTGQIQTGYAKNYSYDKRFLTTPPPYYPVVVGKVIFSQWTEGPKPNSQF